MARPKEPRKMEVEVDIYNWQILQKNYNAEAAALRHAADALREHTSYAKEKLVIFTDALPVVTALMSQHSNELSNLLDPLESLTKCYQKAVIQWVSVRCEISGNEKVDKLAKQGGAYSKKIWGQPKK
jgi:ribonuclease HI